MLPLIKQVQIACDMAARGSCTAGRRRAKVVRGQRDHPGAGLRPHRAPPSPTCKTFSAEQIDGSEEREIVLKMRNGEMNFTGQDYLLHFVVPNLFFHCTTAYDILRQAGAELGKIDFIGQP